MTYPPLITIPSISDLVNTYTITSDQVYVEYYNKPGDGGGGMFYWQTGTAANDSGTIFNSTAGLSGGYWQRVTSGEMATPEWFGAYGNGTSDDTAAINAAILWAYNEANRLANVGTTSNGNNILSEDSCVDSNLSYSQIWAVVPRIYLSKKYAISSPIYLLQGTWLTFLDGWIVVSSNLSSPLSSPLDFMIGTQYTGTKMFKKSTGIGTFFANRDMIIDGRGFLDGTCIGGASMACAGVWTNLMTNSKISGLTVINCKACKWADLPILSFTKANGVGMVTVSLSSPPENIQVNDVVRIYNTDTQIYGRSAYAVVAITGDSITLDQIIVNDPIFAPVAVESPPLPLVLRYMPVGFSINGTQNSVTDCRATNNFVGFAFGNSFYPANTDSVDYSTYQANTSTMDNDDNYHNALFADGNEVGAVYLTSFTTINIKSGFQGSRYENLIVSANAQNLQFRQLYSEIGGLLSPPDPGGGFVGLDQQNYYEYPLNYVGGQNIDINCNCPVDSKNGWFRAFQVDGTDVRIKLQGHAGATQNPIETADYSLVRLTTNITPAANVELIIAEYGDNFAKLPQSIFYLQTQTNISLAVVSVNLAPSSPPTSPPGYYYYYFPADNCFIQATDLITGNTITAGVINSNEKIIAIADSASPALYAFGADTTEFRWTLKGSRTVTAPSWPTSITPLAGFVDGKKIRFRFQQDGTGGRTLTWAAGSGGYSFTPRCSQPVLQTAANAIDYVEFVYDATSLHWECITPSIVDANLQKSSNYTIVLTDFSGGKLTFIATAAITITLPPANQIGGYTIWIINTTTSTVSVQINHTPGTDLINGILTSINVPSSYGALTIKSDGVSKLYAF